MAAMVRVLTGPYVMPNGATYQTGAVVALTTSQRAAIPSGDFTSKLLDISVTVPGSTGSAVASVDGLVGAVDLSTKYGRRGDPSFARGQVVLILDDAKISHYTVALPAVEAVGGRLSLAINSDVIGLNANQMNAAQILDTSNRAHGIAAHSKTHTTMTSLTAAQRVTEWETPKSVLEGIIGAGKVKSWVYPGNVHSAATDAEGYLRYDRLFVGPTHGAPVSRPHGDRTGFVFGRWGWTDANHALTLALVRAAAVQAKTVTIYTHGVDGSDTSIGVTQAEFQELVDLATSLGMRFVTAAEGFPASPNGVFDFGFEDSTLAAWSLTTAGASTVASVADTPDTALTGSRSLRIVGDGSGSNIAQSLAIPIDHPGEPYTFGGRIRLAAATAGNVYLQIVETDAQANTVATTNATGVGSVGGWVTSTGTFTPNALTRTATLRCNSSGAFVGTAYFDHLTVGPTRFGVFA